MGQARPCRTEAHHLLRVRTHKPTSVNLTLRGSLDSMSDEQKSHHLFLVLVYLFIFVYSSSRNKPNVPPKSLEKAQRRKRFLRAGKLPPAS